MEVLIQLIISGILLGGVYSLIGIGLTLIFGVARIINFAHGEYLMMAMYATFWGYTLVGVDPYVSLIPIAIITYIAGMFTYQFLIKFTISAPTNVQVFCTLGLSTALQGLALFLWRGDFRTVKLSLAAESFKIGHVSISIPHLIAFVIAILLTIGVIIFLKYTFTGRAITATVQDSQCASLMGVNINSMLNISFSLGICLAGIAGTLLSPIYCIYPTVGTDLILVAFVIVVLGGLGNIIGATLGGILIGVVETCSGYYISTSMKQLIYFAVFILILMIRPTGFFGRKGAQEVGFR